MADNLETLERYIQAINGRRVDEARRCLAPGYKLTEAGSTVNFDEETQAADYLDWGATLERHLVWSVRHIAKRSIGIQGAEMNYIRFLLDLPAQKFEGTFEFDQNSLILRENLEYPDGGDERLKSEMERALAWARFRRPERFRRACGDNGLLRRDAEGGAALGAIVREWCRAGLGGDGAKTSRTDRERAGKRGA